MGNINLREDILKIDQENVLGSVESLSEQITHAWEEASKVEVPNDYQNVDNLVMCGMGGSGLAARVIQSVFYEQLKLPLTRVNNYDLPSFVNQNSLVVCSSYSGNTEEAVQNLNQALVKQAKILAIGAGGKLLEVAQQKNIPFYKIDPKFNPSNQPRMAIGYSVIGQLVLVSKAGIITLTQKNIDSIINAMKSILEKIKVEVDESNNSAKQLALEMKDKIIAYIAAGHLVGSLHTVNNQLNENAKNFSADFQVPELNHHLMEGLKHPSSNPQTLLAVIATSSLYSDRIRQRMEITQDVIKQNKIESFSYQATGIDKLSQNFELIQFGAYANLYLSILYDQNPAPIPWVDYFKTKLGQPLGK